VADQRARTRLFRSVASAGVERDNWRRVWPPLLIVLAVILFDYGASTYWVYLGTGCVVFTVVACGQDLLVGVAGQASFGGAAFMGIGAYTVAKCPTGLTAIGALVLAGSIGAVVGLVVGLPSLRLRGFYLLLSTLALQAIVSFAGAEYQGTSGAGLSVSAPAIGPLRFSTDRAQFLGFAVILMLVAVFLRRLHITAPGRAWRSIHESELAAASVGVQPTRWKLSAFVWSSAITAVGGGLYAYYVSYVSYTTFTAALAISILTMIFVGGRQSLWGVALGATLVTLLPAAIQQLSLNVQGGSGLSSFLSQNAGTIDTAIFSLALMAVLILAPDGLVGVARSLAGRLRPKPQAAVVAAADERTASPLIATGSLIDDPMIGDALVAAVNGSLPSGDHQPRPLLAIDHVSVRYPNGAWGLKDVSLDVAAGSLVGILGQNGAGKTSLLRAVAGFLPNERVRVAGSMKFDGRPLDGRSAMSRTRSGIILVPERDKAFPTLTVREHLHLVGAKDLDRTLQIFAALKRRLDSPAGLLSGGERQMLALAMAVARTPRLLLVDELSLGLAPIVVSEVVEQLLRAKAELGITVLLVDQDAAALLQVADIICLVQEGQIAGAHSANSLTLEQLGSSLMGSSVSL
jgi:branched-chain amino acid transport system permease protein